MVVEDYFFAWEGLFLAGWDVSFRECICICLKSVDVTCVKCVKIHPASSPFGHHLSSSCRHFVQEGKTQARNVQAVWNFFFHVQRTLSLDLWKQLETIYTLSSLGCGSWTELCIIMHVFVFRMLVSKFAKNLVVSEFLFSWKWTSRTWLSKKLDIGLTFWYSSPVQPCHVVCFASTCGWTWNFKVLEAKY